MIDKPVAKIESIITEIQPAFNFKYLKMNLTGDFIEYDGVLSIEANVEDIPTWDSSGKIPISRTEYDYLTKDLTGISIVPDSFSIGNDGTTYKVSIENGFNRVVYQWWSECPPGWKVLDLFVRKLIEFIQQKVK